ncbi:MAG: sigma-70 family RNA polymerase sigma factor [Deltaproteobacteria bacterium]|nr:sigma-70 family RNA polymerase sigma factor [Deltaproteobacteria bacterium]MBK8718480.1 sigma-70 family RNA polymerase sigma factor [Deltaproteobacteria bacterium]MBP7288542.1 sigma-70 family RNA polymerase sigma factor [Nannocystaceae bacterium]
MDLAAASDLDLLRAWAAADRRAGDVLMRRHYTAVHRFMALKATEAADDLTQQVLLACVENAAAAAKATSFRAYLFGIARHKLLDHLRRSQRVQVLATLPFDAPQTDLSPSRIVRMRREHRLLLRALETLPPDALVALQLFYGEELSTSEVAGALEISVSAVTTRLTRARARLREQVESLESDPATRTKLLADVESWTVSLFERVRGAPP